MTSDEINGELLEALKEADKEFALNTDPDSECDHQVGICNCEYRAMREFMRFAITNAEAHAQGVDN